MGSKRKAPYYIGRKGSKAAREVVLARDGYRCRYCGILTVQGVNRSVDHVIPVSMGGRSTLVNLVTACRKCNARKGHRSLREAGMRMLPRPDFDENTIWLWEAIAKRKCCIHCGESPASHYRDITKPHGHKLRCRDTGLRFFPQDAPQDAYERAMAVS